MCTCSRWWQVTASTRFPDAVCVPVRIGLGGGGGAASIAAAVAPRERAAGLELGLACAIGLGILFWGQPAAVLRLLPRLCAHSGIRGARGDPRTRVPGGDGAGGVFHWCDLSGGNGGGRSRRAALAGGRLGTGGVAQYGRQYPGGPDRRLHTAAQAGAAARAEAARLGVLHAGRCSACPGPRAGRPALSWGTAAAVALLLLLTPRSFDYNSLASGANVYFDPVLRPGY